MLLLFLGGAHALADACSPLPDGLVINKYYLEDCGACKRIAPVVEEIKSKLEKANTGIKYREIECTECECEGITTFPTIEITRDKEVTSKTTGFKDYGILSQWLAENLSLGLDIFKNHIEHEEGIVKSLIARDFLSGFDGQWLILFYDNPRDKYREHFKRLAITFKDRLNIGEVSIHEAASVTSRYNINEYPYVMGLNHGTAVPFAGEQSLAGLTKFADRLYRPNFESLTYAKLRQLSKTLRSGEPVFIVLYRNYELASHYFNDLAQQFKFKANMYKSDDPAMFEAAGIHPHDFSDFGSAKPDHNSMVHLVVYKNATFYPAMIPLDNGGDIVQWIFHTHFAHVTSINNENFYTIFHGIKPVMILLTSDELFVQEFDRVSADRHLGAPYTQLVFATLDVSEYPLFKKQVLPLLKTPAIAFYDPVNVRWYHETKSLTRDNFKSTALAMIDHYFAKKLPPYPPKKGRMRYYIVGAWVLAAVVVVYMKTLSDRNKAE